MSAMTEIRVALFGYGYWGPNLARNLSALPGVRLTQLVEPDAARRAAARQLHPVLLVHDNAAAAIDSADVDALVIATPLATHFALARAALAAGKHVLLEKPMTASSEQARQLVELAQQQQRVLMVDHPFVYSPAVQYLHDLMSRGELGQLLHYDSERANLGPFHAEGDVIWDLAVHDLSILERLTGQQPAAVSAVGAGAQPTHDPQIAHLLARYDSGLLAHLHLSWLSPVKVRRVTLAGSRALVSYDELEPAEKLRIYDGESQGPALGAQQRRVGYRVGDMRSPRLAVDEPLREMCAHFMACIRRGSTPLTDGAAGLRSVTVLEAAVRSLARGGAMEQVERS